MSSPFPEPTPPPSGPDPSDPLPAPTPEPPDPDPGGPTPLDSTPA